MATNPYANNPLAVNPLPQGIFADPFGGTNQAYNNYLSSFNGGAAAALSPAATQSSPGVVNPLASSGAAQSTAKSALSGNRLTTGDLAGAAMADYEAMLTGAKQNRAQAEQALGILKGSGAQYDTMVGNMDKRAAASRTQTQADNASYLQGVQASTQPLQQQATDQLQHAKDTESRYGALAQQWREEEIADLKDTSALQAQTQIMGLKQNYESQMQQLDGLAASDPTRWTPGAIQAAKDQLRQSHVQQVGQHAAIAAESYNKMASQLRQSADQYTLNYLQGLAGGTQAAYTSTSSQKVAAAQMEVQARRDSYAQLQQNATQWNQLTAQAEMARATAKSDLDKTVASFLTSPAMSAYVGQISPMMGSIYQQQWAEAQAQAAMFRPVWTPGAGQQKKKKPGAGAGGAGGGGGGGGGGGADEGGLTFPQESEADASWLNEYQGTMPDSGAALNLWGD